MVEWLSPGNVENILRATLPSSLRPAPSKIYTASFYFLEGESGVDVFLLDDHVMIERRPARELQDLRTWRTHDCMRGAERQTLIEWPTTSCNNRGCLGMIILAFDALESLQAVEDGFAKLPFVSPMGGRRRGGRTSFTVGRSSFWRTRIE
jgi:hypothetical protein